MKCLLLIAALAAGGGLLHHVMNTPGPLTLSDVRQTAEHGVNAVDGAATTAGEAVETVSGIARSGVSAAHSTASYIGGALDSGSRMVDDLRLSMSAPAPGPAKSLMKPAGALGNTPSPGALRARKDARNALPEEVVIPQRQLPASAAE